MSIFLPIAKILTIKYYIQLIRFDVLKFYSSRIYSVYKKGIIDRQLSSALARSLYRNNSATDRKTRLLAFEYHRF